MKTSEKIDLVAAALVLAQAKMKNVLADSKNPFFNNAKYAKLEAELDEIRPVFAEAELALVQLPTIENDKQMLETVVLHKSGQYISSSMPLLSSKGTMQELGSAITYARRYMAEGVAGISKTEDDDGNSASKTLAPKTPAKNYAPPPPVFNESEEIDVALDIDREAKDGFHPGDFVMPFGKTQGKKIKDIPEAMLRGTLAWCKEMKNPGANVITTQKFIEEYFRTK